MQTSNELREHLARFRRRIRLFDGWLLLQRSAWLAGFGCALVLIVGRLWPVENLWMWAILPVGLWLLAAVFYSLFRRRSDMWVARRVDVDLFLKERISSSLDFYSTSTDKELHPGDYEKHLVERLHDDALKTARGIDAGQAFRFQRLNQPLLTAGATLVICVLLMILPNPMTALIAERRAVANEAQTQAEKIDELEKEVEESKELSETEKEELLKRLAELAKQLRANPGSREEALADLSRVEEALRQRLDPNSLSKQAAMEALAARLQELAGMEPKPESGDLSAVAEALNSLAELSNSGSESQRQAVAENLAEQSARASQSGQASLAQALAALAEAVRSGDKQAASQAAAAVQKALASANSEQARQAMLQRTLSQLQNSRQAMASTGKTPGNRPGQNPGQSLGQNPGQGSQQGQGVGAGGGSKANVLPPFSGGSVNVPAPGGNKPVNPADLLGQNIFVPRTKGQSDGSELEISGQDTGQGQEQLSESPNPLPGTTNPALVPYQEVYRQYLDSANRAMDQSYIPAHLKDYVREYFSQLEP